MHPKTHHHHLLLPLLVAAGCSSQFELSTEARSPSETTEHIEKFETKVGVAVLTDEEDPEPAPVPGASVPEQPPAPPEADNKQVEISGVANIATVVHGDLHLHEHYHEHVHIEEKPAKKKPDRIEEKPQTVKVEIQRPKRDPRCERLLREHQERVRQWKAELESWRN